MNPFENEQWIKNCLACGAITPPPGNRIERANRLTAYSVLAVVSIGALVSWIAFLWRH